MHNTGEILQLCRLCLVKEQVNVPIFEGQGDVKQIFQKISSCLPVKINRSDKLPKNICDGCSEKLDLFYDFWNTSVNSEKQLLEWLGQTPLSAGAGTTIAAKNSKSTDPVQQIKVDVKQEPSDHTDNNESFQADASAVADEDETSFKSESGPPPKRARRAATKRKPITVAPDTDDDDDDDYEPVEPLTKLEDESGNSDNDNEDDSFANAPSTSADDQPGPSGIGKDGVEAPTPSAQSLIADLDFNLDMKIDIEDESLFDCIEEELNINSIEKTEDNSSMIAPTNTMSSPHFDDEIFCDVCHEMFTNNVDLVVHCMHYKHFERSKETQDFLKSLNTRKPREKPPPDLEVTVSCFVCHEVFKTNVDLAMHSIKHRDDKKYKCHLCKLTMEQSRKMKLHIRIHDGTTRHKCETCGTAFPNSTQAAEHKYFHTGEKPFQCDICGRNFTFSRQLYQHQKYSHYEEVTGKTLNKYDCKICNKHYVCPKGLQQHQRSKHNTEGIDYSVLCGTCGKRLTNKANLKVHERTHTGVKPFSCQTCSKSFISKTRLTEHERIHTGVRPFACQFCGKGFTQHTSVKIHERIHTGEKPYVCTICSKGFKSKGVMDKHMKICSV